MQYNEWLPTPRSIPSIPPRIATVLRSSVPLVCGIAAALAFGLGSIRSAIGSEQEDFFERKIRPVLVEHCYECHAGDAELIQGGLRLDDPDSMLRGGDSGAAVMPGEPDKSLLLAAIRYDGLEMPPEGPLGDRVVQDFETWIKLGAVDPREADLQG